MIIHPPLNEVVNGIITNTNPRLETPFGEIWSAPFKYGAGGANLPRYQINELRRCLKFMVEKNLVRVIGDYDENTADWNTRVELTEFGEKVREAGSWTKYNADNSELHRLQVTELQAQKNRFRWTTGLSISLFVVAVIAIYQTDRTRTLESQIEKVTQRSDSLSTVTTDQHDLLETKDTVIIKMQKSLDALELKTGKN